MRNNFGLGLVGMGVLAFTILSGCGSATDESSEPATGELSLPLGAAGPSGTHYRLRDATFTVTSYDDYYYYDYGYGGSGYGGQTGGNHAITVSSEDDPNADSIMLSLESGYYYVKLEPGFHMEKVDENGAEEVEATLLSSAYQYVYVSPHSTSWVEYQFGIGERSLWLNGKLNIEIRVAEDPDDYYGGYGYGGSNGSGSGGSGWGGSW